MISMLASMGRMLWRFGKAQGIDVDASFRAAGLDPDLMGQGAGRYPHDALLQVWDSVLKATGSPAAGLEIATHFRMLDVQTLGVAFLSSSTLRTALRRLDRFERLITTAVDHQFAEDAAGVRFVLGELPVPGQLLRVFDDVRMAIVVLACRESVGSDVNPVSAAFPCPEPADTAPYYGLFRCPLQFGAVRAGLCFSPEDANRPITTANRELAQSADHVLQRALGRLGTDDVVGMARREIIESLSSGAPREEDVASVLRMSARTLQRRLADRGTSYTALLGEVRRELAEQYVRDPGVPVAEISYLLGFSEISAFTRAFKRWTGVPPGEYRLRAS